MALGWRPTWAEWHPSAHGSHLVADGRTRERHHRACGKPQGTASHQRSMRRRCMHGTAKGTGPVDASMGKTALFPWQLALPTMFLDGLPKHTLGCDPFHPSQPKPPPFLPLRWSLTLPNGDELVLPPCPFPRVNPSLLRLTSRAGETEADVLRESTSIRAQHARTWADFGATWRHCGADSVPCMRPSPTWRRWRRQLRTFLRLFRQCKGR